MSKVNSKLVNGSDAIVPSSYEVESIMLTASNGDEYDIKAVVATISVTESLYAGSLQAEFGILDAANMLEKLKVVSGEVLHLRVTRRLTGEQKDTYDHTFRIAEVHSYSKLSPGTQTYYFRCVSEHAMVSQTKTISKRFNDVPGALIERLCTDELNIDPEELSINTETKQTVKGVYPRMRPMVLINWLKNKAYDNGSPFFFYETLGQGIVFDSYENMINKDTHKEYIHSPIHNHNVGSNENVDHLASKVLTLSSEMNMSKYINTGNGAYSSTLHTLDTSTKSYNVKTYDYNRDNKYTLNKNGVIPTGVKVNDISLGEHSGSTNFYVSLNALAHNGGSNIHAPNDSDILAANAYMENIDTLSLTVEIYGDFKLCVGTPIDISVVKSVETDEDKRGNDKLLSGRYLVTSIEHIFGEEYKMKMLCKKDSFTESLDNIIKV